MDINIKSCCCFTGHRPEKLNLSEEVVKKRLEEEIRKAINFITATTLLCERAEWRCSFLFYAQRKRKEPKEKIALRVRSLRDKNLGTLSQTLQGTEFLDFPRSASLRLYAPSACDSVSCRG